MHAFSCHQTGVEYSKQASSIDIRTHSPWLGHRPSWADRRETWLPYTDCGTLWSAFHSLATHVLREWMWDADIAASEHESQDA